MYNLKLTKSGNRDILIPDVIEFVFARSHLFYLQKTGITGVEARKDFTDAYRIRCNKPGATWIPVSIKNFD